MEGILIRVLNFDKISANLKYGEKVEGFFGFPPEVGEPFRIIINDGCSIRITSLVTTVKITNNITRFKTLNSIYLLVIE